MARFWTIGIALGAVIAVGAAYGGAGRWIKTSATHYQPRFSTGDIARIVPHRALYKIEMVQKSSSSQVLNVSGQMYFDWKPVCDAWMTDHRFDLTYEYADSPAMRINSDFATYESMDGSSFDFNSRRSRDGTVYEELRGHAAMPAGGAPGQAAYTLPSGLRFDLPPETVFPMGHTLEVLKAARAGKKFYSTVIFDGSDQDGPTEVNAFIGKPVGPEASITGNTAIDAKLLNSKAWLVHLAFFPLNSDEADSDYEMDAILHDNGVISDMHVDYKDFAVNQTLVALEAEPAQACRPPRN